MRKATIAFMLALAGGGTSMVATNDASAEQCFTRRSTGGTCSETLATCSNRAGANTTAAGCRAAFNECMSSGQWIYRTKDGQCYDWGPRRKQ